MASPITLRFEWAGGMATFQLSPEEALAATVALRRLGLGLGLKCGGSAVLRTTRTDQFAAAEAILRKVRGGRSTLR